VGSVVATALLVTNLSGALNLVEGAVGHGWLLGLILAAFIGLVVGIIGWLQGTGLGTRVTDLGLAVAKLGRGGTEVRVRIRGNDEVTALSRAVQYLASDLAALAAEQAEGGTSAALDAQVRELRDRTLPDELESVEGYEMDAALSAGHRGGLDYFGAVPSEMGTVMFLVSAEGAGPASVVACRMVRDEVLRALKAGATPRKALAHTNRVVHRAVPRGVCAKATLVQLGPGEAKVYQAGARAPLLVCSGGKISEREAEGLALGLDEGPVFEKALRSVVIPVTTGVRLVLVNEAALRVPDFRSLIQTHSPKHTVPFMNMVLGNLGESEGGLREDVVLLTAKRS
jgi:hypothetical protein